MIKQPGLTHSNCCLNCIHHIYNPAMETIFCNFDKTFEQNTKIGKDFELTIEMILWEESHETNVDMVCWNHGASPRYD